MLHIARIGVVSYGMYVYHTFVNHIFHAVLPGGSTALAFVCSAVGTYAAAELSYRWFEKRFLDLKKRYTSPCASTDLGTR